MTFWNQLLAPDPAEQRFYGITIGQVTSNVDEEGLGRVKVTFPWLSDEDTSHWARVVTPMAGKERGIFFLPEVDDEVLVAFEHGMMAFPYILGGLWNGKDKPPEKKDDKINRRTIKSTSGHLICLDDTDGEEKIEIIDKSGKNSVIINSSENSITISAEANIIIQAADGKLTLSGKGVEIKSTADIELVADQKMNVKADSNLVIQGQKVKIN